MISPVTLILGLGRDVGTACARHFQERGHRVVIAAPDEHILERVKDSLPEPVTAHHGDLHTMIGLRNAMNSAFEAHQRIDNLVIIPAIPKPVALSAMSVQEFDTVTVRDARAATIVMRLFAEEVKQQVPLVLDGPDRQKQAGTVTFVLSLSSRLASAGKFSESISQATIEAIVKAGAIELARDHIRVNAVSAIRPRAEDDKALLKARTPLGRAALADEIAEAVGFLASPGAAIITGETLIMDGGRMNLSGIVE